MNQTTLKSSIDRAMELRNKGNLHRSKDILKQLITEDNLQLNVSRTILHLKDWQDSQYILLERNLLFERNQLDF